MAEDSQEVTVYERSGLDRIKHELEQEAQKELQEIIEKAEKEKNTILENARRQGESLKQQIILKAKNEAETKKRQEISKVKQKNNMDYLQTLDKLIKSTIEEATAKLASFANKPEYVDVLKKLVVNSSVALNGGELLLVARAQDKAHLTNQVLDALSQEIANATGENTVLKLADEDLNSIGGVIVRQTDGKIEADNTFENRIYRYTEDLRLIIARELNA